MDLTIGIWKQSEKTAEDLAYDIDNVLDEADPATTTIFLYMFYSVFLGNVDGNLYGPVKIEGRYHILGRLEVASAKTCQRAIAGVIRAT